MSGLISFTTAVRYAEESLKSSGPSCIQSRRKAVGRYSKPCRFSIQRVCCGRGISPKLMRVTRRPRLTSPDTNSRVYVHVPLKVSAVTRTCTRVPWKSVAVRDHTERRRERLPLRHCSSGKAVFVRFFGGCEYAKYCTSRVILSVRRVKGSVS